MILDEIAAATRIRVASAKKAVSPAAMRAEAEAASGTAGVTVLREPGLPFEAALGLPHGSQDGVFMGPAFICEVKRASPSKGLIASGPEGFPYLAIAKEYESAGARAISVLTEPDYFLGSNTYLREIAASVNIPVLRKDFIIDEYQIYEAKALGARALLLICALLDKRTLESFLALARSLALSALTEVHNEAELETALACGARIIGINNRDLKTFKVDLAVTERLRPRIPKGYIVVSESGVHTRDDVKRLAACGVDALLVGESVMKAPDKKAFLEELRQNSL
ncbi:MAG: indole-3-glycerol phosphate synthase TrpC [Treponema sp.]|jgi:indole-3-glycerol phosphate synthase|nr:indole-3-glycerol phosphate synthase TrpC [Treponema sp.]